MPPSSTPSAGVPYDATLPWALDPQVSLRPESFGALAYHFGTRRLSFLKSPTLLAVVESLADQPSGLEACRAAGVPTEELDAYERALAALAESGMIRERVA
jgi:putative mycofactocin binding protein MftB